MSDDDLTPTAGARYVLERLGVDGRRATYRGRIVTPDASYEYELALEAGADPAVAARGADAPAELVDTLTMLARLLARGVDKRIEEGLGAWPERQTRWRGPGRGA